MAVDTVRWVCGFRIYIIYIIYIRICINILYVEVYVCVYVGTYVCMSVCSFFCLYACMYVRLYNYYLLDVRVYINTHITSIFIQTYIDSVGIPIPMPAQGRVK